MFRKLTAIFGFIILCGTAWSQDSTATETVTAEAVRDVWNSTVLIDNQTTVSPFKGAKQLIIQHRFAKINTIDDLYGIYGASNIRMSMCYGITDNAMVGFATERMGKLQEFYGKYNILVQKTKGMPVSASYFVNMTIDANKKAQFGPDSLYKFSHRLSYFHQLIISKKFFNRVTIEVAPSFSHLNSVEYGDTSLGKVRGKYQNNAFGITVGGRIKVYNEMSLIFEYNKANYLKYRDWGQEKLQSNYAFGIEMGTGTHCFQVFATTWDKLNPQMNMIKNQKTLEDLMLGFNITVRM